MKSIVYFISGEIENVSISHSTSSDRAYQITVATWVNMP